MVTWAGLLDHRGRRSGRLYRTPVTVRRSAPDAVVIALTWGQQADWCQNVLAAGSGTLRWLGATYQLDQPRIVGRAEAEHAFAPLERLILRRIGVRQFLWLRFRLRPA
jgi:deazaflavin-dependent oxidoreductase (nitroreductase family)